MTFLLIGHMIGLAMGAGGATMSDILFLTSITDHMLDASELRLLKRASLVVIVGLLLLYATGIGFLFVREEGVGERFWAKMTIVGILTLNGIMMHWKVFPILEEMAQLRLSLSVEKFRANGRLFAITGAVSSVSWYGALVLGAWRTLTLPYGAIVGIYVGMLMLTAVSTHIIFNIFISQRYGQSREDAVDAVPGKVG